ncbi:MAG: DUF1553 domain-containing protein [Chthonomonadales bacterium]
MTSRWKTYLLPIAPIILLGATAFAGISPADNQAEFFETKVRPLLLGKCGPCHGVNQQKADLRVDSLAALLKGGKSGPAIVPGKPESSLLIQAISYANPKLLMPPAGQLEKAQIETLSLWVTRGAVWPKDAVPASDKPLWSIQPIARPVPPKPRNAAWVKNPVDAFVLSTLEKRGMVPAPPVGKRELLRRVTFDLIGLPPTSREISDFVNDRRPDAYARVVDRLLASPRYGERWSRYWLDLVRYADTNGYERDVEKPYSYKYRDYVIQSLNSDKPYNQFVTEQLAGDEMPGHNEATLTATGFLRLGTWDDEPNDPVQYKYERLDDLVHVSSTAFLGLTIRCARCHDHKFDPILQKDYYALGAAFFNGYLDPDDRALNGGPPMGRLKYPVLGFTEKGKNSPPLHLLINGDPRREADVVPPAFPSLVTNFHRTVDPPSADADTSRRRLQLADWITDPRNPLTARVMVNRIWQNHFGEGLSRTPNNFGRKGSPPTHPELLDWLSTIFVSDTDGLNKPASAWSIKKMHRLILLSNTYQMSSLHPLQEKYNQHDSGNELLWRFNRRRLDADAMRDSILAVSGQLNLKEGGPGFVPTVSRAALEGLSRKGAEWLPSPPDEQNRRTIYMFLKRSLIMPLLTIFDFADTTQPLEARDVSLVAPQALALLNNPFLQQQSEEFARVIEKQVGPNREKQVAAVWQRALGRNPSPTELSAALTHLTEAANQQKRNVEAVSKTTGNVEMIHAKAVLWLRADQGVETNSSGQVTKWVDAAGKHSAAQIDPKAQPTFVKDPAGRPVVRFDGKGKFLAIDGQVIHSQQFTIIAVANDRDGGMQHREIFSNWNSKNNIGPAVFFGLTGKSNVRLTDFFAPAGTVSRPSDLFVLSAINSSTDSRVYQNRSELARVANPLPPRTLNTPYVIGQQGNINGEYWNGDILEVQVYDHALTDAERESIWDDISKRHGIAGRPIPADAALASLCHVLFNTSEFLYVD